MSDIFTTTAIITRTQIRIECVAQCAGTREVVATEPRPATLADADTFLAFHGVRRIRDWDLGDQGTVEARVAPVRNLFNGVRAARLREAVGTTHEPFAPMSARELACSELDGWLISDLEITEPYLVAGSSLDGMSAKIHMVGEGKTWEERYSTDFHPDQTVMVAKRKR